MLKSFAYHIIFPELSYILSFFKRIKIVDDSIPYPGIEKIDLPQLGEFIP